jgi:hypothetical protein
MREAPACLAKPLSLTKSKPGLGCDAVDQNLCSPNGVAQAGPRSIWCDEMRSVLRLVGIGDTSKLGMVTHTFRLPFNHEIKAGEGALPCRENAMTILCEVLCLSFVCSSTEVQSPFEPNAQQGRDVWPAAGSNGRKPIQLGTRQLIASLRPLRRRRIRAAEGAQFGFRNWFSHATLRSLRGCEQTQRCSAVAGPIVAHAPGVPHGVTRPGERSCCPYPVAAIRLRELVKAGKLRR